MKIAIIGAGCVGSVIATRLFCHTDASVMLIAEEDRGRLLKEKGLIVNDRCYHLPVLEDEQTFPDVIIVCVKNYQLVQACNDIKKYISKETVILPLLNSVTPVPIIRDRLMDQCVLYGYISRIDSLRDDNGYRYNLAGDIHFGHADNKMSERTVLELKDVLEKAGFSTSVDDDIVRGVWKKWMLNIGANQVSALTGANYLEFAKIPEIEKVLRMAMKELILIASKENVELGQEDVEDLICYLTTYQYPKKTSMLQDVLSKRKTEIEAISGEVLNFGRKWGISCPVNETMFYLIRAKEQVYLG